MELWEVVARERMRDTIARYTWSGDSMKLDELAEAFCDDGELELRGREPARGRAAIIELLRRVPTTTGGTRIVRHSVTNIRFLEVLPAAALVASYFTVVTETGLDHYGRYRDTFVPVGDEWLLQHRFASADWHSTNI